MDKQTVLLVEDNEALNEANRRALEGAGYEVMAALTLGKAREHLTNRAPDVILLDIMMPDGNGIDFCAKIRDVTDAHIIFLTSRNEQADKLRGLLLGGDDYIIKPFDLDELLARVAAAMRRQEKAKAPPKTLELGRLTLDLLSDRALLNGNDAVLTPKEFSLLYFFAQHRDETIDAERLYSHVWGQPMADNVSAVKTTVYRLRSKLEGSGYTVSAVRGEGYRFERHT